VCILIGFRLCYGGITDYIVSVNGQDQANKSAEYAGRRNFYLTLDILDESEAYSTIVEAATKNKGNASMASKKDPFQQTASRESLEIAAEVMKRFLLTPTSIMTEAIEPYDVLASSQPNF
jgi:hypothetical protein